MGIDQIDKDRFNYVIINGTFAAYVFQELYQSHYGILLPDLICTRF